ncbi:MAG: hypothetical protein ACREYF_10820 [Gammaproteobacteria bacterium]
MDLQEIRQSLGQATPPVSLEPPLKALWHDAKGEWDQAHHIVQQGHDAASAWVHAYLHRKEGDSANADYWYRRAQRSPASAAFAEEWEHIVLTLLCEYGLQPEEIPNPGVRDLGRLER